MVLSTSEITRISEAIDLGLGPCSTVSAEHGSRVPRKEVIQPHLPVRLPCYDFVPITSLTLGRRLHCWLANALRAKPAFMT